MLEHAVNSSTATDFLRVHNPITESQRREHELSLLFFDKLVPDIKRRRKPTFANIFTYNKSTKSALHKLIELFEVIKVFYPTKNLEDMVRR